MIIFRVLIFLAINYIFLWIHVFAFAAFFILLLVTIPLHLGYIASFFRRLSSR